MCTFALRLSEYAEMLVDGAERAHRSPDAPSLCIAASVEGLDCREASPRAR
jgi:hypothetical protein